MNQRDIYYRFAPSRSCTIPRHCANDRDFSLCRFVFFFHFQTQINVVLNVFTGKICIIFAASTEIKGKNKNSIALDIDDRFNFSSKQKKKHKK